MGGGWETAFVAMSVALGEPEDVVGVADRLELPTDGRPDQKARRARALALAIAAIALDVERMEVVWR